MTPQELIHMVNDFAAWKGNTYTLAMMVLQQQREDDAALAETVSPEAAALIREP